MFSEFTHAANSKSQDSPRREKIETGLTEQEMESALQAELKKIGESSGIKFSFPEVKTKVSLEISPAELNWQNFSQRISPEDKESFALNLKTLINYLNSPVIVDHISDHTERRAWEKKNLEKLSPEARTYYSNNRLGLNFATSITKFIELLNLAFEDNIFTNTDLLTQLNTISGVLPKEFQAGGAELYASRSLEEKIALTDELTPLILTTIRLLTSSKLEKYN